MRLETTIIVLLQNKYIGSEPSLLSLSGYGTDVNDCIVRTRLLNVH